jgi:hypothetical protein
MVRMKSDSLGSKWVVAGSMALLAACGGGNADIDREAVLGRPATVVDQGENAVWRWGQIAAATITSTAPVPRVTPEEQRPQWAIDLATVHAAIYDAVIAIAATHKPYAITPQVSAAGASMDAAATAAAYGVLKGLFPNRSAVRPTMRSSPRYRTAPPRRKAWRSAPKWRPACWRCAPTTGA